MTRNRLAYLHCDWLELCDVTHRRVRCTCRGRRVPFFASRAFTQLVHVQRVSNTVFTCEKGKSWTCFKSC